MQKTSKIKLSILALTAVLGTGALLAPQTYAETSPTTQTTSEEASSPIKDYDKVGALEAAIDSALNQVPDLSAYYSMYYGVQEVQGIRAYTGVDSTGTIAKGSGQSPQRKDLVEQITAHSINMNPAATYGEGISSLKQMPLYSTDSAFKDAVDQAEAEYNSGVETLRTILPLVDPTLTDLNTKTGDELLAIYNELPAVKNRTYDSMIENIEIANSIIVAYDEGTVSQDVLARLATETYEDLVASATTIEPNFKVDLSEVKKAPTKNAPAAPNSGDIANNEISATLLTIAIAGVAGAVTVSGLAITAKRYIFSPLKRRK